MDPRIVSVVVLVALFVIATTLPVNLGALALVAAFGVGLLVLGASVDDVVLGTVVDGEIVGGFPGDLFLLLVGLTYLFALARANGTVDVLVRASMRLVRGRVAAVPWVFFGLSALLSAIGALFAVAIVAPLAMPFAHRHRIPMLLMGLMVVHGALGGAFSPISVYGAFVDETMVRAGLPTSPLTLFLVPLVFNLAIGAVIFALLGGRTLLGRRADAATGPDEPATVIPDGGVVPVRVEQVITLGGLAVLAVGSSVFGLDVGAVSIALAVALRLLAVRRPDVLGEVSWSTVLLICGVVTYVGVLTAAGTVEWAGELIGGIGVALLAALLLCYLGGVLSAFASSVGILGVAIPLAVPFLRDGEVGVIGMITALAVASTVVDVSPFSTNGALVLANAPAEVDRDQLYRRMLAYAGVVVAVGPPLAWATLVVPGLLS